MRNSSLLCAFYKAVKVFVKFLFIPNSSIFEDKLDVCGFQLIYDFGPDIFFRPYNFFQRRVIKRTFAVLDEGFKLVAHGFFIGKNQQNEIFINFRTPLEMFP